MLVGLTAIRCTVHIAHAKRLPNLISQSKKRLQSEEVRSAVVAVKGVRGDKS